MPTQASSSRKRVIPSTHSVHRASVRSRTRRHCAHTPKHIIVASSLKLPLSACIGTAVISLRPVCSPAACSKAHFLFRFFSRLSIPRGYEELSSTQPSREISLSSAGETNLDAVLPYKRARCCSRLSRSGARFGRAARNYPRSRDGECPYGSAIRLYCRTPEGLRAVTRQTHRVRSQRRERVSSARSIHTPSPAASSEKSGTHTPALMLR